MTENELTPEQKAELEAKARAARGEPKRITLPMPELVQRLKPRQAAALCGTVAELVFWAIQVRITAQKVAEAWALGRAHPLALLATVETPRKVLSLSGSPPPPITKLAGAAMPTQIIAGIEQALSNLERGLDQADKLWAEEPNEDVLEKRIRERIVGALTEFVGYVASIDEEQTAEITVGLTACLVGFAEKNGLKLPALEADDWRSFWAPGCEPTEVPELNVSVSGIAASTLGSETKQ